MSGFFRTVGKIAGAVATVAAITGNPAIAALASAPSACFLAGVKG